MRRSGVLRIAIVKLLIISAVFLPIFNSLPSISAVLDLPDRMRISAADLNSMSYKNVGIQLDGSIPASIGGENEYKLKFKLFNLLPIKTISAQVEHERKVFVGGFPIGLSVKINGVVVVQKVEIETFAGRIKPTSDIEEGDIISKINGKKILYTSDITEIMQNFGEQDRIVEMVVVRNGSEVKVTAYPVIENLTGYYRLGLAVKDAVDGVGTVSYIKSNGRFGCLGHPISSNENNNVLPCYNGNVYDCRIIGYSKGSRGVPGELKGTFINISSPIGHVETNTCFGVYGMFDNIPTNELMDVGSRHLVKVGKAQILTTINDKPTYYDIEIIKTVAQNSPNEKSMIIRVTDKELLSTTGGILQGMSGSPIIQDNKIIGAVTHVFLSDPTKGYGVYLDWMYEN